MQINNITGAIVDAAIRIHKTLGPGLLESVYQKLLAHELRKRGLSVQAEVAVPVVWDGVEIELGYRADLIVEGCVIVELKSVERVQPVHKKQVLTYLKISGMKVGLLINFGQELLKDGIHRVVSDYDE